MDVGKEYLLEEVINEIPGRNVSSNNIEIGREYALDDILGNEQEPRTVLDTVKDIGVSAAKGIVSLPQGIVGLADIHTGGLVGKAIEDYTPVQFKETQNTLDTMYSPAQQLANRKVAEAKGFVESIKAIGQNPSTLGHTVIQSLPSMIGAGGIGRLLTNGVVKYLEKKTGEKVAKETLQKIAIGAGAAGEGLIGAGATQEQAREESKTGLTTAKQSLISSMSGVLTAGFGFAGGKLAQKLGIDDIETILSGGKSNVDWKNHAGQSMLKAVGSMISEGLFEELPQSFQEQIAGNLNAGREWSDGVAEASAMGLLSGGAMGLVAGGGGHLISRKTAPVDLTGNAAPEITPEAQQAKKQFEQEAAEEARKQAEAEAKAQADFEQRTAFTEEELGGQQDVEAELKRPTVDLTTGETISEPSISVQNATPDISTPAQAIALPEEKVPQVDPIIPPENNVSIPPVINEATEQNTGIPESVQVEPVVQQQIPAEPVVHQATEIQVPIEQQTQGIDTDSAKIVYAFKESLPATQKTIISLIEGKISRGEALNSGEQLILKVKKEGLPYNIFNDFIKESGISEDQLKGLSEPTQERTDFNKEQYEEVSKSGKKKKKFRVTNKKGTTLITGITEKNADEYITNKGIAQGEVNTEPKVIQKSATQEVIDAGVEAKVRQWTVKDKLTPGQISLRLSQEKIKLNKETIAKAVEDWKLNLKEKPIEKVEEKPSDGQNNDVLDKIEADIMDAASKGQTGYISKLKTKYGIAYNKITGNSPTEEIARITESVKKVTDEKIAAEKIAEEKRQEENKKKLQEVAAKKAEEVKKEEAKPEEVVDAKEGVKALKERKLLKFIPGWIFEVKPDVTGDYKIDMANKKIYMPSLRHTENVVMVNRAIADILEAKGTIKTKGQSEQKKTFEDIEKKVTESVASVTEESDIQFKRNQEKADKKSVAFEVELEAKKITLGFKNPPEVKVVQSNEDCPTKVQEIMKEKNIDDAMAFVYEGKIYLVADNISSLDKVPNIMAHELTHSGLGRFFSKNPDSMLKSVRLKYDSLMDAIYKEHSAEIEEIAATTHKHLNMRSDKGRRQASEEWLANQAYTSQPKWYDRLVAIFKDLMRALHINMKFSDREVRVVLQDAFKEFGETNGIRFMTTGNHGSGILFQKFSDKFTGKGQGLAIGWGVYISDLESVGKYYANISSKKKFSKEERDIIADNLTQQSTDKAITGDWMKLEWDYFNKSLANFKQNGRFSEISDLIQKLKIKDSELGVAPFRHLYKVSIGKEGQTETWIDWNKPITATVKNKILAHMKDLGLKDSTIQTWDNGMSKLTGEKLYKSLSSNRGFLESNGVSVNAEYDARAKAASKFLLGAGIDGNRVPVGYLSGKQSDKGYNYVVFNAENVNIEEHIAFSIKEEEKTEQSETQENAEKKASESFGETYKNQTESEYATEESLPPDMTAEDSDKVKAELKRNLYVNADRSVFELPEMVEMVLKLTGFVPRVRHFLGKQLSVFRHNEGTVDLIDSISPEETLKILAKNIGRIMEWMPDMELKRGNIFAKIAAMNNYFYKTLEEYPGSPNAKLTVAEKKRIKKAADEIAAKNPKNIYTYIVENVPQYRETKITPEMILQLLRGLTNQPKEVLDYLKSVDGPEKASIVKEAFKGVVSEPIMKLNAKELTGYKQETKVVVTPVEDVSKVASKLFQEMLAKEVELRKLYKLDVINEELRALSIIWNPFDPKKDDAYTDNRFSSRELYSDAVSVLLNKPDLLKETAPTFWKAFFSYMERRPTVKAVYDEIDARMKDRSNVVETRSNYQKKMIEASAAYRIIQDKIKTEKERITHKSLWHEVRRFFDTQAVRYEEITKEKIKKLSDEITSLHKEFKPGMPPAQSHAIWYKVQIAERKLRHLLTEGRLDYHVHQLPYLDSEVYAYFKEAGKVVEKAHADGVNEVTLSQFMINERIINDRKNIDNPQGITAEAAKEINDGLKKEHKNIEQHSQDFRKTYRKYVVEPAVAAGFLSKAVVDKMLNNEYYVTYNFLKGVKYDVGDGWGEYRVSKEELLKPHEFSSPVMKQYGGLGEIDNVIHSTMLKGEALIFAARHHQVKMMTIEELADSENPEDNVRVAKRTQYGFQKPPEGWGLVVVTPNGKLEGYYIEEELAELWNKEPHKANALLQIGLLTKKIITKLFIAWSLPWTAANFVRDFFSTWKKVPGSTGTLLKAYKNTMKEAWAAAHDKMPEREMRLLRDHAIAPGRFTVDAGLMLKHERQRLLKENPDLLKAINREDAFNKTGYTKFYEKMDEFSSWWEKQEDNKKTILPPLMRWVERVGLFSERWGKFAGDEMIQKINEQKILETGVGLGKAYMTNLMETRVATPDAFRSGLATKWTEIFFPFSRMSIQDLASGVDAYKEHKTAYALKTLIVNVLPRIALYTAAAGMMGGDDNDLQKIARKISSYHRKMYNCIPLGTWGDEGIFFTVPQDYTGSAISSIVDSILTGQVAGKGGVFGGVAVAQPFNLNPFLGVAKDWAMYYTADRVPIDYYGNKVMTKREEILGGTPAAKALVRMTWNEFFGSILFKFDKEKIERGGVIEFTKQALRTNPANFFGKFIRISRQGEEEIVKASNKKLAQKEAEIAEDVQKEVFQMINNTSVDDRDDKLFDIYDKYVEAGKIDPKKQPWRGFRNNYMEKSAGKEGSPYLNEYVRQQTNSAKANTLFHYKDMMDKARFDALMEELEEKNLVTGRVLNEYEQLLEDAGENED